MSKNYRTPEFEKTLKMIESASDEQIADICRAVIKRYKNLFPGWQVVFLSVPTSNDKERMESIEQMLEFLKGHKEV